MMNARFTCTRSWRFLFVFAVAYTLSTLVPAQIRILGKVLVPMRDGVKLAVDVYLPDGEGPFPVVVARSVYGRGNEDFARPFLTQGLAFVPQDTRGRGDSEGEDRVFEDAGWGERQDGVDTIAWVRQQPWCNGKVGTWGGSALGITQVLLGAAGAGVTCQSIQVAPSAFYGQMAYRGGVWHKSQNEFWLTGQGNPHVIDRWKSHPADDAYWAGFDAEPRWAKVTAPAVHVGGWWDMFTQGTLNNFTGRQYQGGEGARGNQILLIGPWAHAGPNGPQQLGDLEFPANYRFDVGPFEGRFFRHWLLGEENGIMEEPPVHYYTVGDVSDPNAPGNVWRTAEDWPPVPVRETRFYLAPGGRLSRQPGPRDAEGLAFVYDPGDPCPTHGGGNYNLPAGPFDQREVSKRPDVLVFQSDPLTEPLEIAGRVTVRLYVTSNAVDTDFTAKLIDVYPDGREILMLDGIYRMKYRNGFEKAELLSQGEVAQLDIDLWSISLIFNRGHRIAVHVSSSNYPRFDKNPNTGADFADGQNLRVTRNTVFVDEPHPSALIVPVCTR